MRVDSCCVLCCIFVYVLCVSFTNHLSMYRFCSVCPELDFWSKHCCAICLYVAGVLQVSGMRIYTSGDVEAVNGTDVRLKCTFQSSSSINPSSVIISWSFRPLKPGREESVSVQNKITPQTSLVVSGNIHPLTQLREESVSHQAPYRASKTACVYMCVHI